MGEFVLKTRIFMGKDGLDEILQGVSRAFIVTDRFMHESGKVSYLTEPLEARNIEYQIFSEVKPWPRLQKALEKCWNFSHRFYLHWEAVRLLMRQKR